MVSEISFENNKIHLAYAIILLIFNGQIRLNLTHHNFTRGYDYRFSAFPFLEQIFLYTWGDPTFQLRTKVKLGGICAADGTQYFVCAKRIRIPGVVRKITDQRFELEKWITRDS